MATLSDPIRAELHAEIMSELSNEREPIALTKVQLRAAVDAADGWIDSNAASFNTALPAAARTNLTAKQKLRLLMIVAARRFKEG